MWGRWKRWEERQIERKEGPEAEGVEASRCSGSREAEKNVGGGVDEEALKDGDGRRSREEA